MATAETKPTETKTERPVQLPAISRERLPYHPAIQERFGIDRSGWRALVEAIFPNAVSIDSVIMALSYCKARNLDPFKRNVHIVPIWNKALGRMVDTVWPGIGELRTTAFRTGEYAGLADMVFGPDITQKVGHKEMTYPEWAQVTVYRMVKGQRVSFAGPRVYWIETYATIKRDDDSPNDMWANRPRGQLAKCAESAALRAAFPEEVGGDYIPEEVQHGRGQVIDEVQTPAPKRLDDLTDRLTNGNGSQEETAIDPEQSQEQPPEETTQEAPAFDADAFFAALNDDLDRAETLGAVMAIFERDFQAAPEEHKAMVEQMCNARREKIRGARGGKQSQQTMA